MKAPLKQVVSRKSWLYPLLLCLALAGYWAPWINHRAAALVLTGVDMGEYVKFLPQVRAGEVNLVREVFYLPLFCASVSLTLLALNARLRYHLVSRGLLLLLAWTMALSMLPPVWTPTLLLQAEFRKQTIAIALCIILPAFYPWLKAISSGALALTLALLGIIALLAPVSLFFKVLPFIAELYGHPLTPGWGLYLMATGFTGLITLAVLDFAYAEL